MASLDDDDVGIWAGAEGAPSGQEEWGELDAKAGPEALAWEWGALGAAQEDNSASSPAVSKENKTTAPSVPLPWQDHEPVLTAQLPAFSQHDNAEERAGRAGVDELQIQTSVSPARNNDGVQPAVARRFSVIVPEDGKGGAQVVAESGRERSPPRLRLEADRSGRMHEAVTNIGISPSPVGISIAEMAQNAEHRLRIVEEDRDLLSQQAVALQRMLDKERRDRHTAQTAQQQAQQALRDMVKAEAARVKGEHDRVSELTAKMAQLRARLSEAANSGKGASSEVVQSLQTRTDEIEVHAAQRREQRRRAEQEMVRRLAISLKVLQLQRQFSDQTILSKQRIEQCNDSVQEETGRLREEEQRKDDRLAVQARRLEAVYAEESRMMRQLQQIKSETAAFARMMRAEAARYRQFEDGLAREVQEAEHEVKVHRHLVDEMRLEAAQVFGPSAWDDTAAGSILRAKGERDAVLRPPGKAPQSKGKQPVPPGRDAPNPGKGAPRRGAVRR